MIMFDNINSNDNDNDNNNNDNNDNNDNGDIKNLPPITNTPIKILKC